MEFYDYDWHDAELRSINFDRSRPGQNDTIIMDVVWPDETPSRVVFSGVYKVIMDLNFGFIGTETIYSVSLLEKNEEDFIKFKNEWKYLDLDIQNLNFYLIETATMRSSIKIIARNFKVIYDV